MESSIAEFLRRQSACELLPTTGPQHGRTSAIHLRLDANVAHASGWRVLASIATTSAACAESLSADMTSSQRVFVTCVATIAPLMTPLYGIHKNATDQQHLPFAHLGAVFASA